MEITREKNTRQNNVTNLRMELTEIGFRQSSGYHHSLSNAALFKSFFFT